MKVKSESAVAQSFPTLSDPMDCSLPGSSVHGIFQARVLEWGAIAFSDATYIALCFFGSPKKERNFICLCNLCYSSDKINNTPLVNHTVNSFYLTPLICKQNVCVWPCPWRRQWHPTPVLLPGISHGRRSLVGYSPWGCKESDTTEWLHFTPFTHFVLYRWRRKWQPTPVFLPGESHGQRRLAGHGPWGCRESDMTQVTEYNPVLFFY